MNPEKLPMAQQQAPRWSVLLHAEQAQEAMRETIVPKKKNIEILHTTFLRGPSIWTYRPALEAWVDLGELENFPSNKLPGFPERLAAWLPSLVEHRCGIGERGGFLQRLRDGTWPGTYSNTS